MKKLLYYYGLYRFCALIYAFESAFLKVLKRKLELKNDIAKKEEHKVVGLKTDEDYDPFDNSIKNRIGF